MSLKEILKPYLDFVKQTKPSIENSPLDELNNDIEVIKSAFDNDLIDVSEFKIQLDVVKAQINDLLDKKDVKIEIKQDYADAIIFNNRGELLLLRRAITDGFCPDCWALPGGKIELGETPEQAVIREVAEETNLNIVNVEKKFEKDVVGGKIHYFSCVVENEIIEASIILDPKEHISYCFVTDDMRNKMHLILDLNETLDKILVYRKQDVKLEHQLSPEEFIAQNPQVNISKSEEVSTNSEKIE